MRPIGEPRRERRRLAWMLAAVLCVPSAAAGQNSQSLVLRPKVLPPPVAEVQTSCAACQPQADSHNRIARQINDRNRELAFRRREVDLQSQAVALVEAEIAGLQAMAPSPDREARMNLARQRLEAYRAQLAREQARVAELEQQVAQLTGELAAAKAALQACEESCRPASEQSSAQAQPAQPQQAVSDPVTRAELRLLRKDLLLSDEEREKQRIEAEQFEANLKAMAGDQWAGELAAFFTSTLFAPDTPFDTAYVQNIRTLQRVNEPTPEQIAADAALARENARVAAQRADARQSAIETAGQSLEHAYTREARGLLGPGYADLPSAGETHKTAALMAQDAHMGQLLQFRANLNIIKIGDGTVSNGSFINLGGAESFTRLSQINHELGVLRAGGSNAGQIAMSANVRDDARIAALEAERAQLLKIDGIATSDGLMTARAGLIDGLAGLSPKVYETYWTWIGWKESGGIPEKYWNLPPDQQAARWQADLTGYENAYLSALGQSPFLGAMVDPAGSGDAVPLWQYLTSTTAPWATDTHKQSGRREWYMSDAVFDPRTQALDQVALTQAIDFLDTTSAQVIDQFGTIVTTVPLLNAYGSPVFAPLRAQVVTGLSPIYPSIALNMDLLSSQYEANWAAGAETRIWTDAGVAVVQVGVGVVIVVFPFTAPVLVPVEIGLTAGQVGLEGLRTYWAWQDLQQVEQAAAVGAGASYLGVKPYQDLFKAQVVSFIVVTGVAPLSAGGSLMSLEAAQNQIRLAAAVADTPTVATGTRVVTSVAADTVAQTVPDFATFRAMRPDEQVAAIKGLPEDVRGQLVSQLNRLESNLFVIAWEKDVLNAKMIASVRQDDFWREMIGGNLQPLSAKTRNASDQEILDRLSPYAASRDQIVMDPAAWRSFYDDVVETDLVGPFTTRSLPDGEFPTAGTFTSAMSQAEIDALFAKPVLQLTPEEVALKADLLLQDYGRPLLYVPHSNMNLAEIEALFAKTGELTPQETALKADLVSRGWGRANVHGDPEALKVFPIATPQPFNPFAEFGPAGAIESKAGTVGGALDSGMSGSTQAIPGRPRNPNRTQLFDDPDLPPDTLIFEPFNPPAAGLLDMPFDIGRLLQGEPLPLTFWHTGQPSALRMREPRPFEAVQPAAAATDSTVIAPNVPLGTIVHFNTPPLSTGVVTAPPPWIPFVTKVIPIGCRFTASAAVPDCDQTTYAIVVNFPPSAAGAMGEVLRTTPGFVYGEGDELRVVQTPDPYFNSSGSWGQSYDDQWALKKIGLSKATPGWSAMGKPVTVAVIDTGVAWNHRDLSPGDLWLNSREIPANNKDDDGNGYIDDMVGWNFVDSNNLPWDFNGHGTLVAGIIGAGRENGVGTAGVNPGARIMVLKAMDERGQGRASIVTEAIIYAAKNGARVINLSVGGRRLTRTEELALEYASAQGAVVVVAAGNGGIDIADYGPGGLRRALTVVATDPADRRIPDANFGAAVDLAAPGVDILGPRAMGTDLHDATGVAGYRYGANVVGPDAGYIRATGTSFAAPLVSGVASLLLAANPALSAEQVERMLLQSARDVESPGFDHLTGYGRLDATAALAADPAFFVEASISRVEVVQGAQGPVARVLGTADAERFAGASIEIGAGERPSAWTAVKGGLTKPVKSGVLGEIPAAAFQGSAVWTLRLVANHANGRTREARFLLRLN